MYPNSQIVNTWLFGGFAVPRVVPNIRLALLAGEYQISQDFKTRTKGWGLPRHTVVMTNKRMIVSCKQRFLFCMRHEWETSILYKCVLTIGSWFGWVTRVQLTQIDTFVYQS
jgi:hypothetical protein